MSIMQMLLATSAGGVDMNSLYNTSTWLGNATARDIDTGLDMTDGEGFVWIKNRDNTRDHLLYDTLRGANVEGVVNSDGSITTTNNTRLTSFNNNGFSLGNNALVNESGDNIVAWSFKEGSGFLDIIEYSGNGVNGRTLSHSLGETPGLAIIKAKGGGGYDWMVWHPDFTNISYADKLNEFGSQSPSPGMFTATPTSSSLFLKNNNFVNGSGENYMAYIFGNNDETVKCSSYTGNSSTQTVNVGFQPQWLLIKDTTRNEDWVIVDSVRTASNGTGKFLFPNKNSVEATRNNGATFVSNGFSLANDNVINDNNRLYIYMAIAAA